MVNLEIPKHYTASPSSISGTPHLTINREATIDLDSSNAFEGPEKLLEVWFSPSSTALPPSAAPHGLKSVTASAWTEMLELVGCKVLSVIEHEHVDAYLLSESSMFVFPHKLVLKTCGTTTLLCGLPRMLEIAGLSAGFPYAPANRLTGFHAAAAPYRVFYSRKNFQFPDKQRGPHRSWRDEVRFLDRLFQGGSAYMIGKMNGEHWYLYITNPDTRLTPPSTPDHEQTQETPTKCLTVPGAIPRQAMADATGTSDTEDETLEVLMTDLDEVNARQFYLDDASAVAEGRFVQKAREARATALRHLGSISEHPGSIGSGSDDDFDVFEQTSSDHSSFASASDNEADGPLGFPEALTTEGHALGTVVAESCGLADVYPMAHYPDSRIDAYLFTPCGFSANGVVPAPPSSNTTPVNADDPRAHGSGSATHYFTVHVTPEPQCSYASFETNVPARQSGRETADIVEQVVRIFRPGRFSVTIFEAKSDGPDGATDGTGFGKEVVASGRNTRMDRIPGYRRVDRIVHDLDGYDLVFRYYERWDWQGGAPRIGEVGC